MIKIVLLMLSLLLVNACSKDSKTEPEIQLSNVILPLAVDNYWVFADTTYQEPYVISETSKIKITGFRRITYNKERKLVYYWNWFDMPENIPHNRKTLVRNEEEGLIYYGQIIGSSMSDIDRKLFIKYPAEVADEWLYSGYTSIRCISVSSIFSTPLGDFDCHVYELFIDREQTGSGSLLFPDESVSASNREGETTYLYYAPEVGYVGMIKMEGEEIVFKRTLIDYHVAVPIETGSSPDRILSP